MCLVCWFCMPASLPPRQGWHLPVVSAKLAEMSEETNYFAGKTPPRLPLGLQTFQSCLMLFPARSGHAFAEVAASCGGSGCETGFFERRNRLFCRSKRPVSASQTGRLPMAVAERAPYGWLTAAWEFCLMALPVGGCAIAVRRAMPFATLCHIFGQMVRSGANNIMCAPTTGKESISKMQSKVKLQKILVEMLCPKEKTPYLCIRFRG